ncbi:reverse transcriptase domain-containing protein [Tanacetum coccineum]
MEEDAERAFQELKRLILELPTLTTPELKEILYAYMAVSRDAVTGALVADQKGKQTPIQVITDQPIKQILNKPEVSGKLAKYAVELGAYNITYVPRNAVKGQVLTDFINEILDTKEVVDKCDSCQIHAPVPRLLKTRLTSIMSPWPFYQWGLDILGPLPESPGKLMFIIVAIDYFTKWMEAKPLAKTTTGKRPIQELVCKVEDQADEYGSGAPISQRTGRKGKLVSDARLGQERVCWVDEWPNILWAHRTMLKTSNGETPFSLTYGSEAVIPAETGMPTYRTIQFNKTQNEEEIRLNLDLIQERRETAAIREAKYKKKVEQYYNKRVRPLSFKVGDFVYRRNESSRVENQGKLGPN